ncbi:MAG TPA: tetratricopeptide repeat-containing serine protease family protein [Gemmataceae bacterium]|jgi:S1-C subfamily serine protease|nr:tetratricopeptide repeat-containing serine protease family protein [Gemmataceae bacterium]
MTLLPVLIWFGCAATAIPPEVRATVWIRAGDNSVGTGWVVNAERRWMVTARHVIGDRSAVDVYFPDFQFPFLRNDRLHYLANRADLKKRGLIATGRVLFHRDAHDLTLLELDQIPAGVPALRLAECPPRVGDECHSIGHRHDADVMWNRTDGYVRQSGSLPDGYFWAGKRLGAGVPILFLQLPIESGDSGSAVLNARGEVIGVISAVINPLPELAIAIDLHGLLAEARKDGSSNCQSKDAPTRVDADALARATVWVRPQATGSRAAGALIDIGRGLVLTSATAVGSEQIVDVVVPKRRIRGIVAEADEYRDLLGLRLDGHCVSGVVLARDRARDLALVELDSVPEEIEGLRIAAADPHMGNHVAAMGHPTGIDALWLYAAGSVRSIGQIALARDGTEDLPKVNTTLLQLPHQGSACGGPVVNEGGELIGILAARESPRQDLAYAATPTELRAFLASIDAIWQPKKAADWQARGRFMLNAGRLDKARDAFKTAVTMAPRDREVRSGYAAVLLKLWEKTAAMEAVDQAIELNPGPNGLAELAGILWQLDETKRAVELVANALDRDPKCAAALVFRARLRSRKQAMDDIAEALFISPNYAPAFAARAGMRDLTDNDGRRDAIADWSRFLELRPIDLNGLRARASLFETIREPKKAVADWSRVTELEPLRMENWISLARARFAAGDRNGGADALVAAVRVQPDRANDVFRVVRDLASQLAADNPADTQRVLDWCSLAVTKLAGWLPN